MTGRALWALPKRRVDGKLCPPMLPGKNYHLSMLGKKELELESTEWT